MSLDHDCIKIISLNNKMHFSLGRSSVCSEILVNLVNYCHKRCIINNLNARAYKIFIDNAFRSL